MRGGEILLAPVGERTREAVYADVRPDEAGGQARDRSTSLEAFLHSAWPRSFMKRACDLALSSALLVLLSPVFVLIGVTLAIHLRSNPFFFHERVTRGGKVLTCLKFRTMRESEGEPEIELHPAFKAGCRTRTTWLTRWLRGSSLDELPQLINVLRGDMSIVGPRPVVRTELLIHFGQLAPILLTARPGMSGLWTVNGRSNVGYPERALIELRYATTASAWMDIKILLQTVVAVISRRGAL